MTNSSFSVRGRCAIVAIKGEREIATLRRQLDHLGMSLVLSDVTAARDQGDTGDVVIVDIDVIPNDVADLAAWTVGLPVIALVGVETPSRRRPHRIRLFSSSLGSLLQGIASPGFSTRRHYDHHCSMPRWTTS